MMSSLVMPKSCITIPVRQMTLIEDKQTKHVFRLLVILLPMLIVPMVSYDFLINYFKHFTVIFSSMIVGFMIGVIILLVSDKIPRRIIWK